MESDTYQQEEGAAMGSPLSPVLANVYMEYFEEMRSSSTSLKLSMWLRYVDDIPYLAPTGRYSNTKGLNSSIYTVQNGQRTRK